jgi:hypothetical protein
MCCDSRKCGGALVESIVGMAGWPTPGFRDVQFAWSVTAATSRLGLRLRSGALELVRLGE